jgi:hypothetical protein
MKVTSKNGVKLNITPKRWWSIREWFWVFYQADIIKNQDISINTKGWKFTLGKVIGE